MAVAANHLIWIDLEMTGLNPDTDRIIEIATLITDSDLNELAEGPVVAIRQTPARLAAMDEWNQRTHGQSGLLDRIATSECGAADAEAQTLEFLAKWVSPGASPMCGNSICQDRRFLARYMPALEAYFHYRNLDVSTLKILASHWAPATAQKLKKQGAHEALADIRESVEELKFYREHFIQGSQSNH